MEEGVIIINKLDAAFHRTLLKASGLVVSKIMKAASKHIQALVQIEAMLGNEEDMEKTSQSSTPGPMVANMVPSGCCELQLQSSWTIAHVAWG